MENRFLNNKIVLKYCPQYYRIINEDFTERDIVSSKLIETYQTFIFSVDVTNKNMRKEIKELDKIIVKYFEDRNFKKELTKVLLELKVPKDTKNIILVIIKTIKKAHEKYMEGFTRNLYIPKWI